MTNSSGFKRGLLRQLGAVLIVLAGGVLWFTYTTPAVEALPACISSLSQCISYNCPSCEPTSYCNGEYQCYTAPTPLPPAPTPISPVGGPTYYINNSSNNYTVNFSWGSGYDFYTIRIYKYGSLILEEEVTDGQSLTYALPTGGYYWKVAGASETRYSSWSANQSFTISLDSTPPSVPGATIYSPTSSTNPPLYLSASTDSQSGFKNYIVQVYNPSQVSAGCTPADSTGVTCRSLPGNRCYNNASLTCASAYNCMSPLPTCNDILTGYCANNTSQDCTYNAECGDCLEAYEGSKFHIAAFSEELAAQWDPGACTNYCQTYTIHRCSNNSSLSCSTAQDCAAGYTCGPIVNRCSNNNNQNCSTGPSCLIYTSCGSGKEYASTSTSLRPLTDSYNNFYSVNGQYKVYVYAQDNVGNISAPVVRTITVDNTRPSTPALNSGFTNSSPTASTSPQIAWTASDNMGVTGYYVNISNFYGWEGGYYTSSNYTNPLGGYTDCYDSDNDEYKSCYVGSGTYSVMVYAYDAAGNWSSGPLIYSWMIDSNGPNGSLLSINSGATYTKSTSVTLNLSCSDSHTSCGQTWIYLSNTCSGQIYSAPPYGPAYVNFPLTVPAPDGLKYVSVRFTDAVGNSSACTTKAITLDTFPPTISSVSIPSTNGYINTLSGTLNISASDTLSGPKEMRVYIRENCTVPTGWTAPVPVAYSTSRTVTWDPLDGTRYASVRVYDNAGNESACSSTPVNIDTKAPGAAGNEVTPDISNLSANGRNFTKISATSTNSNGPTLRITCSNCSLNTSAPPNVIIHTDKYNNLHYFTCSNNEVSCNPVTGGVDVKVNWSAGTDNNGTWQISNALLKDAAANIGTGVNTFTISNGPPQISL